MGPDKQMRWFVIVGSQRIFQINELILCTGSYHEEEAVSLS